MRPDASFEDAFDDLYPRARQAAHRVVNNSAAAEEVAAEALALAYLSWSRVSNLPHRDAWVLRVAINLAIGMLQRGAPLRVYNERPSIPDEDDIVTHLALAAAVRRLPRRQREVVALRYLGDMSEAEVAGCLGIRPGTVKSHLHRGVATLRTLLGASFEEGPVVWT